VIAKGGMGEVWRAAQVGSAGFSKPLAIKRILPHLAEEPDFVNMLIDEAKISATLTHPNILQVLDLGRIEKNYFIAMEFLVGQALNRVIATSVQLGERLPVPFCLGTVHQALLGLTFAHEKKDPLGAPMGIIHRDISPHNIMVTYQGEVKLADFGIAKAKQRSSNDTTGGKIKGKPGYMAPEQVTGGDVDQRLDIYAMGVVLHELLCLKRMRRADTDMALLMEVARGTVPRFEDLGVAVPADVAQVVYRALAPNPADRFQTAREFADVLAALMRSSGMEWGTLQEAGLMARLFPIDIEKERQAELRFSEVIAHMAAADSDEVVDLLNRLTADSPTPTAGFDTRTRHLKRHRNTTRTLLAAAGAVVLLGVGAAALMALRPVEAAVQVQTGSIILETQPPGATLLVNGTALPRVSPTVAAQLVTGPVELEARLAGYLPARQVLVLEPGKTAHVTLKLEEASRSAVVQSTPAGAQVLVDGKSAGRTPLSMQLVGNRAVTVRVVHAGYVAAERRVTLESTADQLVFELQPEPARKAAPEHAAQPTSGKGTLTLRSEPWARVFIDGKDTGKFTPVMGLQLAPGRHAVKLVNDEVGSGAEFSVVIKAGAVVDVNKVLR